MEDKTALKEAETRVRGLIRSGMKTSAVIAETGLPTDFIKRIKSEELENDKRIAKANLEAQTQRSNEAREKRQNERFMAKYKMKYAVVKDVVAPAETETSGPAPSGDVTVQAPALGADTQQ